MHTASAWLRISDTSFSPEIHRLTYMVFVKIKAILEPKAEIWLYLLKERRYRLFVAIFEKCIFVVKEPV